MLSPEIVHTFDNMTLFIDRFQSLSAKDQDNLLKELLSFYASTEHNLNIPTEFLDLCLKGMSHLESVGKGNLLYKLVKGFGTLHHDNSDYLFLTSRMPIGLLHYMVHFFNDKPGHNVSII